MPCPKFTSKLRLQCHITGFLLFFSIIEQIAQNLPHRLGIEQRRGNGMEYRCDPLLCIYLFDFLFNKLQILFCFMLAIFLIGICRFLMDFPFPFLISLLFFAIIQCLPFSIVFALLSCLVTRFLCNSRDRFPFSLVRPLFVYTKRLLRVFFNNTQNLALRPSISNCNNKQISNHLLEEPRKNHKNTTTTVNKFDDVDTNWCEHHCLSAKSIAKNKARALNELDLKSFSEIAFHKLRIPRHLTIFPGIARLQMYFRQQNLLDNDDGVFYGS